MDVRNKVEKMSLFKITFKLNMKNIKIVSIKFYPNADKDKLIIYEENKNKSGIYCWNNLITGKIYIGSAKSLRGRFTIYYSLGSINRKLAKGSSAIYSAILKYGYFNFSLYILEYCDIASLIEREQYYIDTLKPEYNILKTAGSRLGTKHTETTKDLIRTASLKHRHSAEDKLKMKELAMLRKGNNTSFYGKNHTPESILKISFKKCVLVQVLDTELNTSKVFRGYKEVASYLNIGLSTLRRYKKFNKLIKNKYLVSTL